MSLNDYQDMLVDAIESKKVNQYEYKPRTSAKDVTSYYKETKGLGLAKLAEQVVGRQPGVKAKEDKPYQAALRSFQRIEKGQYQQSSEYRMRLSDTGEKLPPKQILVGRALPKEFEITVEGDQDQSDGSTRPRTFSVTFKGDEAKAFADNPSYRAFFY